MKENKFNKLYNKIITEMNMFSQNKTKLKCSYNEADDFSSPSDLIEKYIDYSDTNWIWDKSKTKFENILNLLNELKNDPPYSDRVVFIMDLLTDKEQAKLQELRNEEIYNKRIKDFSNN